jgi:hypothetical protein
MAACCCCGSGQEEEEEEAVVKGSVKLVGPGAGRGEQADQATLARAGATMAWSIRRGMQDGNCGGTGRLHRGKFSQTGGAATWVVVEGGRAWMFPSPQILRSSTVDDDPSGELATSPLTTNSPGMETTGSLMGDGIRCCCAGHEASVRV